jgi:flagellar biogenesis protein FliO
MRSSVSRLSALAGLSVASVVAFAQEEVVLRGTKSNIVSPPTSGPLVGPMEILQLLAALVIVGSLLKWGLPWLLRKGAGFKPGNGAIVVKESTGLGTSQVHLIEVNGRPMLIGTSPTSISFLTRLDEVPIVVPAREEKEEKVFFEILDEQMETPQEPEPSMRVSTVVDAEDGDEMSLDAAIALLKNAKKRTGMNPEPEQPAKAPARAVISAPSDDDILAKLDRIARLAE